MWNIPLLLAWRYTTRTHLHSVSTMSFICFCAVMVGSFALTLVVSIMSGFEVCTYRKLRGIHAPIVMDSPGNTLDMQRIVSVLSEEFSDVVLHYAPSTYEQALIGNASKKQYCPITIKGVDPLLEPYISDIESIIHTSNRSHSLSTFLKHNQVILGKKLANELQVEPGQTVRIMCPDDEHVTTDHIDLHEVVVTVGGIFKTGIEEFDQSLAYCSLELLHQMFDDSGITKIGILLQDNQSESSAITTLSNRFGLHVYSWKDLYPSLISALKLEKYAMFFVMLLIMLVASMNMISLIYMYIQHKHQDIALLSVYGMSKAHIQSIFIIIGVGISSIASLLGISLAIISGYCIDHFKLIALPDSYYVSHLPVIFDIHFLVVVFLSSIIISFFTAYYASGRLLDQNPIHSLSK